MALDLAKTNLAAQAETGYEFELLLPESREKTGSFITVRGAQSKTVKAYGRKRFTEYQVKQQMAKRRGKEVEDMNIDELEDSATENAIIRIISWRGIEENGVAIPFNKENADRVLREHDWIRSAIMEESDNLLNFQ